MEPGLLIFLVIKTTLGIAMPLLSVLLLQRIVDGLLEGTPLNSLLFYAAALLLAGALTAGPAEPLGGRKGGRPYLLFQ